MNYAVEYFDRFYAEGGAGSSAHTIHALRELLNKRPGWRLHSALDGRNGWILIWERDDAGTVPRDV